MELLPVAVSVEGVNGAVVGAARSDVGSQFSELVSVAVGRMLVTISTVVGVSVGVGTIVVEVTSGGDTVDVGRATVELLIAVGVTETESVCEAVGKDVGMSVLVPLVMGMLVGTLVAVPVAVGGVAVPVVELPMGTSPVAVELMVGRTSVTDVGILVTVGMSVDVVLPIGSVKVALGEELVVGPVPKIDVGMMTIGVSVVDVSVSVGTTLDVSVGATVELAGVGSSTLLRNVSIGLRMPPSLEVVVTAPVEVPLPRGVVSGVVFSELPVVVASLVVETTPVGAMTMGVSGSDDFVAEVVCGLVVVVPVVVLVVGRIVGLEAPPVPTGGGGTTTVLSITTVFTSVLSVDEVSSPRMPERISLKKSLREVEPLVVVVGVVLWVEMGLV